MKITVAKSSGFCFGVQNAVDIAESFSGNEVCILGELIHNKYVVEKLRERGIKTIDKVEDCTTKKILIRSHGEPKSTYDKCAELNLEVIDATCKFVKQIHSRVEEYHKKGYQILIVGNKRHCEVIGINGWCENSAIILEDENDDFEAKNIQKLCVVCQTTYSPTDFEKIIKKIMQKGIKLVEVFSTICYTTSVRLKEAEKLSKENQLVVVIGGFHSSNTQKLFKFCEQFAEKVIHIERFEDINISLREFDKVAIVAGASTPSELLMEVRLKMVEQQNVQEEKVVANEENVISTMDDVMKAISQEEKQIRKGQVSTATIIQVNDDGLMLHIGASKKELLLVKDEINIDGSYNKDDFQSGDTIEVKITNVNPLVVSRRKLLLGKADEETIESLKDGKEFKVLIEGFNKGGLVGKYKNCSVFIPSSQIKLSFIKNDGDELKKYIGKELRVATLKIEGKKIIASAKVILEAEKKARIEKKEKLTNDFFGSIEVGNIVSGKVVRFTDFGAFVNVEGFDCLAHISDLSWTNIAKADEVLKKDELYNFVILKIDNEKKHVSIGYKQLQPRPWQIAADKYHIGDIINGTVVRLAPFGAFIKVEAGIDGLVHISQITYDWIEKADQVLKVGQEVTAKIIEIDPEVERMSLSIKATMEKPEEPEKEEKEEKSTKKDKKSKSKVKKDDDENLREWTSDSSQSASIGELLKGLNLDKE